MLKLVVAGGRDFDDYDLACYWLDKIRRKHGEFEVVCGMARGADKLGYRYAISNGLDVAEYPADWETHGKRAGILRNIEMGDYADAGLVFWDGKSRGSKHMIDYLTSLGKSVKLVLY